MESSKGNQSRYEDSFIYDDDDDEHNKTYVTVNADSFNEKDFNSLLNCLDTIRDSENKRRKSQKVIKNYCVQVPYVDNSVMKDDSDMPNDDFERTCDEMKSNISQMFSYFDEDVDLNYEDYDKLSSGVVKNKTVSTAKSSKLRNVSAGTINNGSVKRKSPKPASESFVVTENDDLDLCGSFREKFLRNRRKIKEMTEVRESTDSKPIIRGVIKKPNAPNTPNNSLNKNQVDKIMNEFNRVKINYYSKDNYVEFTNIDYFYCDSDLESLRSEKVGKLKQKVLSKFETQEVDDDDDGSRKSLSKDDVAVPKNSVRDKISMFSKLDTVTQPCIGAIQYSMSAPLIKTVSKENYKFQGQDTKKSALASLKPWDALSKKLPTVPGQIKAPTGQMNSFKNSAAANKNQNKCFIADINNSLRDQVKRDEEPITEARRVHGGSRSLPASPQKATIIIDRSRQARLLEKITSYAHLSDIDLLSKLEGIVNNLGLSLLHTIDGLMNDDAFTLVGNRMRHLKVETCPSIERFNETFGGAKIDCSVEEVVLSVIETNKIQLQLQVTVGCQATGEKDFVNINVIFMAQYETTDGCTVPVKSGAADAKSFFIYFTSLFEPPENELQKARESNVALSEHQLRVQASLQKLNIPDWYKQYSGTGHNTSVNTSYYNKSDVTGQPRKRHSDIGRWQGLSSKTTSLSSLGSNRSDRSPVMLSPSAHSHTGGPSTGFSRWSTSHLNSSQTSPSVSARSSFVRNTNYNSSTMSGQSVVSSGTTQTSEIRNSFRKPYLGWRSQEKLSRGENQPRGPAERLASSLMSQKQAQQKLQHPVATPEIQSSIKEVTSAIVHYVNDQNRGSRSRSVSPSARCWLESSFVGTKPLDSPQTPALENSFTQSHKVNIGPMSVAATSGYNAIRLNGIVGAEATSTFVSSYYPSVRSSATSLEEEVILSLLGLPSDMHKSSSEDLANQSNYRGLSTFSTFKPAPAQPKQPASSQLVVEQSAHSRRHSEGDAKRMLDHHSQDYEDEKSDEIRPLVVRSAASTSTSPAPQHRRVSLDSTEARRGDMLRCRYPRCENAATPADAKKTYKSCHNCSHLYCSRDCRRNHWERGHRRACLHSRVSALCRQVLSACKDDPDTLKHLSLLARRGFLSHGRGVVRLLFRSPENSDLFIKQGFQFLGEVSYVRWPDLLPSEMGPELYSELLRLSTEYKPDSKMLIYVAICVVSEAPGSSTAPVKWERQLVSRCAKLKLCKTVTTDRSLFTSNNASKMFGTHEYHTDVLILTFNVSDKFTQKSREVVLANVQQTLQEKGINLRKHFPEVYQRLSNYVEGISTFLPVTIHPRDNSTGRPFVCIIFPQNDSEKIKLPPKQETGDHVQTIDVGIERTDVLTHSSLNDDLFTEGTKF